MQEPPTLRADACCSDSEDKFQYKIKDKDKKHFQWHGMDWISGRQIICIGSRES